MPTGYFPQGTSRTIGQALVRLLIRLQTRSAESPTQRQSLNLT